jgi:selenide, water dikinase
LGPGDLARALAPLPVHSDPRLLVGRETFDDAGVFALSDELALIQTVDFFAPIVDDPYTFGRIAAANALSDVYAMGGEPMTALAIAGFPSSSAPIEVLTEILRGGHDTVHDAGAVLIGGHTIIDEEIKFGLAVTGRAHPKRLLTNAGARPGQVLVLTKPLGTGLLATAHKAGALAPALLERLVACMMTLNATASRAALQVESRCATDITGFGLLGHATNIARASNVTLRIVLADVPVMAGALEAYDAGARTGGADRNASFLAERVEWHATGERQRAILLDPQTSGGLLVAVPAPRVAEYLSLVPDAVAIGSVEPRGAFDIELA